jgi:hypothetical protein
MSDEIDIRFLPARHFCTLGLSKPERKKHELEQPSIRSWTQNFRMVNSPSRSYSIGTIPKTVKWKLLLVLARTFIRAAKKYATVISH